MNRYFFIRPISGLSRRLGCVASVVSLALYASGRSVLAASGGLRRSSSSCVESEGRNELQGFSVGMKKPFKIKPFKAEKVDIREPTFRMVYNLNSNPQLSHLHVDVVGGNLSVEIGDSNEATLEVLWQKSYPTPDVRLEGNMLSLRSTDYRAFRGQKHVYAFNFTIPASWDVTANMKAGVISIDGIAGRINLNITTGGSIVSRVPSRNVSAHVGAGDVLLYDVIAGQVNASTYAGNVYLDCRHLDSDSRLHLKNKLGDVKVLLPAGSSPSFAKGIIRNAYGAHGFASTWLGDVKVGEKGVLSEGRDAATSRM